MIICVIVLALLCLLMATDPAPGEIRPIHDSSRRRRRARFATVHPSSP
jgi:hypothetical protein